MSKRANLYQFQKRNESIVLLSVLVSGIIISIHSQRESMNLLCLHLQRLGIKNLISFFVVSIRNYKFVS